jgi:hypothetical protein
MNRGPGQRRAGQVEASEEDEVRGNAEVIGNRGRDQTPEQVAGDVAGDVGGEGTACISGTAFLSEPGKRQRECGCHAQPLRDAQRGKCGKVRRRCQGQGRDRKDDEARDNPEATVDARAEQADAKTCDRHAKGAGVDRKTHRSGRHVIVPRQRGKDRLRREQIHHGQECHHANDGGAQGNAGRRRVACERNALQSMWHDGSPLR